MKKEEIEFILENTADHGSSIVAAAVKKSNPLWKEFFDAGWVAKVAGLPGVRRDILRDLVNCSETEVALDVLRRMLDKKKPKDLVKLFGAVKRKETLLSYWAYFSDSKASGANAKALVMEAVKIGLDLNHEVEFPLRRGGVLKTTPLGLSIHVSFWNPLEAPVHFMEADLLVSNGAKFDDKALLAVMICPDLKIGRDWARFASERDLAQPQDFLRVANDLDADQKKYVNREMVSLVRAMSALTVCNDVMDELNLPKSRV